MWIVAIAWIYVVALMSFTETSIVAAVMTFVGYCVIPLSILFYLTGGKRRRARREAAEGDSGDSGSTTMAATGAAFAGDASSSDNDCSDSSDSGGSDSCSDGGGSSD